MMFRPIAILAFVCLVAFVVYAKAGGAGVPLPERNPLRPHGAAARAPVLPGDQPTVPWTDQEIADARAECTKALSGLAIEYEPLQPIKHGICGAPAPILVRSIGSDPKVEIAPPATVTCPLAAALSTWLSKTVQPDAKAVLSTEVVKLRNATSYSCRNRYGGANTPLSEHALANALDVSEFVFASGEHITVLESWPRLVATPPAPPPNPSHIPEASAPIKTVSQIRAAGERPSRVAKIRLAEAKINPFVAPITVTDARTNPFVFPTAAVEETPSSPAPETISPKPAPSETRSAHDA